MRCIGVLLLALAAVWLHLACTAVATNCAQTPTTYNLTLIFSNSASAAGELSLTRSAINLALSSPAALAALGNDSLVLAATTLDDGCSASGTAASLATTALAAAKSARSTVAFGGSCPSASQGLVNASTGAQLPFLPFVSASIVQSSAGSAAAFPYALNLGNYPVDVLNSIGAALTSVFYYFDWTKIGIIHADDANSIALHAALYTSIVSPSGVNTNATLAAQYVQVHTDTSNERYATVNGATAGELPFKNPLPLPMWVVPPLTPLPSDERDSTLAAKIDAQLAAYLDADVRVFVFLCPLEIAKRVAAAMYASGQYGAGYAIVLTPHLASTLLVSDASLFKVFNGALQVQFYKWAKDMFTTAFVNANGKSPGVFADEAYDAALMAAKAIGAARAACLDPASGLTLLAAMRNISFAGASGDVAWPSTKNDRIALASSTAALTAADLLQSAVTSFQLENFVDFQFKKVGSIVQNRLYLVASAALVFPGPTAHIPRQYRIAVHYASSLQSSAFVVAAVRSALRYALNVTASAAVDSLVLAPFCIIDGDAAGESAALQYMLAARPPMAIIGPSRSAKAIQVFATQTSVKRAVQILSYGDGYSTASPAAYPYFARFSFGVENGVRFVMSAFQHYAQNRIGVIWCDDRALTLDQQDSMQSWQAFQVVNALASEYGVHLASTDQVPITPQTYDFTAILNKYISMGLTTCLLILPQASAYQVFATAALMSSYTGTSYVTFVLSYTTYFPGIDMSTLASTNLANVAATWFVATFRRSFATPAFAGMLSQLTTKYGYTYVEAAGVSASATMAFDAALACNQLVYQSMKVPANLMDADAFRTLLRTSDFATTGNGVLLTGFASGPIVFDSLASTNNRIGAPGQEDVMQIWSLFPARVRFASSVDNFVIKALIGPPSYPNYLATSTCCTDPGWGPTRYTTAAGAPRVACLPCTAGMWAPIGAPHCFNCSEGMWCALGAPMQYAMNEPFLQPTIATVPLQIGQQLLPQADLDQQANRYYSAGAAVFAFVIACGLFVFVARFLCCPCCPAVHRAGTKFFKRFDIIFTLDHGVQVNEPLTPKKTVMGGFFFFAFLIFAIFAVVYFADKAFSNQFHIVSGSSAGFSDLLSAASGDLSAVVPLSFNVTFIGIDNSAACASVCASPPSGAQAQFYFSADASVANAPTCTSKLSNSNTSCWVSYSSMQPSILLPPALFANVTISNTMVQAIYYEVSALRFLGAPFGLKGTLMPRTASLKPDPHAILQGAVASILDVSLDPFQFNASLLSTSTRDYSKYAPSGGAVGHLSSYLGETLGSTANFSDIVTATTSTGVVRGAAVMIRFSRSQTVVQTSLSSSLNIADQISAVAAFIASFLLVILRFLLMFLERSIAQCRQGKCGRCCGSFFAKAKEEAFGIRHDVRDDAGGDGAVAPRELGPLGELMVTPKPVFAPDSFDTDVHADVELAVRADDDGGTLSEAGAPGASAAAADPTGVDQAASLPAMPQLVLNPVFEVKREVPPTATATSMRAATTNTVTVPSSAIQAAAASAHPISAADALEPLASARATSVAAFDGPIGRLVSLSPPPPPTSDDAAGPLGPLMLQRSLATMSQAASSMRPSPRSKPRALPASMSARTPASTGSIATDQAQSPPADHDADDGATDNSDAASATTADVQLESDALAAMQRLKRSWMAKGNKNASPGRPKRL